MKIAVTGHRPDKLGNEYDLKGPFSDHIRKELQEVINTLKPTIMISGMALGVDTIWAILAKENNIPLMAVTPFPSQDKVWRRESKELYNELLKYARNTAGVFCTGTDPYEHWKMDIRNQYMINVCDLIVAVYNGDKKGGTFNCVTYAESVSKPILKINPNPTNYEIENQSDGGDPFSEPGLWPDLRSEQEGRYGNI